MPSGSYLPTEKGGVLATRPPGAGARRAGWPPQGYSVPFSLEARPTPSILSAHPLPGGQRRCHRWGHLLLLSALYPAHLILLREELCSDSWSVGLGWVHPPPSLTGAMSTWLGLAGRSHDHQVGDGHGTGKLCAAGAAASSARPGKKPWSPAFQMPPVPPDDSHLLVSLLDGIPAHLGKADFCYQYKAAEMRKGDFWVPEDIAASSLITQPMAML